MKNMEFHNSRDLKNETETAEFAQFFLNELLPQNLEGAAVVALSGDLGSGKTTFTKKSAEILGVKEIVTSPTFVIQKQYEVQNPLFKDHNLIHIDAYRLEGSHELEVLGFSSLLKNPKNIIFIEWPERVIESLPTNVVWLKFEFVDETTRKVQWV